MSVLQQVLNLVLMPPGDLYYHLTLLFMLQVLLAVSWGHWRRTDQDPDASRLLWAAGGMLLTRVALVLASAIAGSGAVSLVVLLPPLERFMDLSLIPFAAWAFLPLFRQRFRLGTAFLGGSVLLASLIYAFSVTTWPPAEAVEIAYNNHWQAQVWELTSLSLVTLALVSMLIWSQPGLGLLAAAFLAWLWGHLAQLLLPSPVPHLAGATRLANLVAIPLLAALAFQETLRQTLTAPLGVSTTDASTTKEVARLLELARQVEQAQDPEIALAAVLRDVVRYIGVDMAAVGLPAVGEAPGVRVVARYPIRRSPPPLLSLDEQPLLAAAARTRQPKQADSADAEQGVSSLLRQLGFQETGALLVEPLVHGREVLGLFLAGNLKSEQPPSETEAERVHGIAEVLATALSNARHRHAAEQKAERLTTALRERETERTERGAALQGELEQAREDAQQFARRVTELEEEAVRQQRRADELAELLHLREEHTRDFAATASQVTAYEEELRQVNEARKTTQAELDEWKQRAQQLEQQQTRLERELQASQVQAVPAITSPAEEVVRFGGTLVADERGNVVMADGGAQRLLSRSQDDLRGVPLHAVFASPTWSQAVNEFVTGQAHDGTPLTTTFQRDDRSVHAELARLTTDPEGPSGYIAVLRLGASQEDRNEVVASLANELRTPMTSIVGYTDLLLSESVGILGDMQQKFLQRIKANIERLSGFVNDLVEVTAIDAGQIKLTPEPANIVTVIEEAIMGLSAQFRERDLTVRLDMALELPPIEVDRDSLYQVVLHLLANACQCSQAGTEVHVTGHLEEAKEGLPPYLRVSVTDTGGGIAEKDQLRVFQRFYRADSPLIAGLGETGVGMAIAKALVEANRGRIWLESEMGVGSTFSFILPVARPTQATESRG